MQAIFHDSFQKKFTKLLPKIQEQFRERLRLFLCNPHDIILNNHSVKKVFPGSRSINITGDYRAIFYEHGNVAIFIEIGTHAELY